MVLAAVAGWLKCRGKRTEHFLSAEAAHTSQMELTKGHVADALVGRKTRKMPDLARRFAIAVKDLRGRLDRWQPSCVVELLQEHFAEYSIRLFAEDGAEDDGNSVVRGDDIDGLFLSAKALDLAQTGC